MKKITDWNRSRGAAIFVCGGIFILMLVLNIWTPYICDDYTYRLNFLTKEPLGSLLEVFPSMYAHSWKMNGRLISHGLAQVFMLLPPAVFDIVNAGVFTLTLWLVHRLCFRERNALGLAALFCLLWLGTPVFGQVVLWQVGALNYFWSLTGLVLFILPPLLRFTEGREFLRTRGQWVLFCICGFFFGWYSEIASFVGICMAVCLVVLDVWMNRRKFQAFRLLPVLTAVLGYLTMLSMPAQTANKQAGSMTLELLKARFAVCNDMLVLHLRELLILFALLFVIGLLTRLPGKTMVLSGLFALAGVCANYMPIAASYYPERCLCTSVMMLVMAVCILAGPLAKGKGFPVFCGACCLLFLLTLPAGLRGCRDICQCHRTHVQREETIAAALENGQREVTANIVDPQTPWSGYYGLRDLSDTDPDTWPNHSMALYYGLDSLLGE